MVKKKTKKVKGNKFIYWAPRILAILFILFLAMFSLDVFGNGYTFWETIVGLFMHNIPSLILLAALIISWKKNELIGAITFILAGLFYFLLILINILRSSSEGLKELIWTSIISGPALLIGILFLINWGKRKASQ